MVQPLFQLNHVLQYQVLQYHALQSMALIRRCLRLCGDTAITLCGCQ
jgi:hypothetical protein